MRSPWEVTVYRGEAGMTRAARVEKAEVRDCSQTTGTSLESGVGVRGGR